MKEKNRTGTDIYVEDAPSDIDLLHSYYCTKACEMYL
jgi:hypothetical protein